MTQETKVLYNDTCPVCSFEIDHYRKTAADLPIRFDRISQAADWGISPDQAARRLHVMQGGKLLSGMAAFRALWSVMPRYRWLARLTALPLIRSVLDAGYDHIAAPMLYRAHLRRVSRSK
jgi:predicted DCC family thiol-disulfide oxidoreductase YuxK